MSFGPAEGAELGGGRYVLECRLGRGGAATVWRARDTVLERPVAVKILSEALAGDASWLARFNREARLAASLSHPNLVSVYDFDASSERPFLVMAHMPGGSLYEVLESKEDVDPECLARDLLSALEAIHSAGIIHRDIKPGNVLFAADGSACLTDFGVARPEDATQLTQTGHIPGTARYMAPELWKGHPADERSDLYACGILLRQTIGANASAELSDLIASLAAEDPYARPPSASNALAQLSGPAPPTVPLPVEPPPEEPTAATRVVRSEPRSHHGVVLAALAAFAAVAAIALGQALGGGDEEAPNNERASGGDGGSNSAQQAEPQEPAPETPAEEAAPEAEAEPKTAAVTPAGDPVALNQQGFELIQAGQPKEAVPLLRRAVSSYPEDSTELDYAYALYNLGNALHLSGKSKQAIPILEKRLEFNDQTETVQQTLSAAREAAGVEE